MNANWRNPDWKYIDSRHTDLRKTFSRVKRELRENQRLLDQIEAERVAKVAGEIKRRA